MYKHVKEGYWIIGIEGSLQNASLLQNKLGEKHKNSLFSYADASKKTKTCRKQMVFGKYLYYIWMISSKNSIDFQGISSSFKATKYIVTFGS